MKMDAKERIAMSTTRKCGECGGSLQEKNIVPTQPWGDHLYRFEDVPALACLQCGHIWISADVSQLMDEAIPKHLKPRKYEKIPVFSLAEIAKA